MNLYLKIIFPFTIFANCCLQTANCFSQPITFEKTYNFGATENGYSVEQTLDGGYIIAGRHGISFTISDLILLKVDSLGIQQWVKFISSGPYNHEGWDVKQTTDSGYVVTGVMDDITAKGNNVYLVRTDKNGDTLWTKYFDQSLYDQGWSVIPTFDGGYAINADTANSTSAGWLIKVNYKGDTIWTKTFLPPLGTKSCGLKSIEQLVDSGFVLVGDVALTGSMAKVYFIRINKNGDTLWTKEYARGAIAGGNYVQEVSNGEYIIAGLYQQTSFSNSNCFLIKTNSNGDTLWTKIFGNTCSEAERAFETIDKGLIVFGSTPDTSGCDDFYLAKMDNAGISKWQKSFGGSNCDQPYDMKITNDRGFIMVGTTSSFNPNGIYLVKVDSTGSLLTDIDKHELKINNIDIFPNPFNTSATVILPNTFENNILYSICDIAGRQLISKKPELSNNIFRIERNELEDGIYFLNIYFNTHLIGSYKIIIQ